MGTEFPGSVGCVASLLGVALEGGVGGRVEDITLKVGVGFCYGVFKTGHNMIVIG